MYLHLGRTDGDIECACESRCSAAPLALASARRCDSASDNWSRATRSCAIRWTAAACRSGPVRGSASSRSAFVPTLIATSFLQEEIARDGQQVGPGCRCPDTVCAGPCPDERLGRDVLGIGGVTGEPIGEAVDVLRVAPVEAAEIHCNSVDDMQTAMVTTDRRILVARRVTCTCWTS